MIGVFKKITAVLLCVLFAAQVVPPSGASDCRRAAGD